MSYVPTATVAKTIIAVSTSTTAVLWNTVYVVDATAAPVTITLPTAVGNPGLQMSVLKSDSSQNAVTVVGSGTQTINGVAPPAGIVLSAAKEGVTLDSDGANVFAMDDVVQDVRPSIVRKAIAYTAVGTDDIIEVDATSGPITITLPLSTTVANTSRAKQFSIKKIDATTNAVTISRTGVDVVEVINSSPLASAASTSFTTSGAIYTFTTNATLSGYYLGD